MTKGNDSREFFEIFKPPQKVEASQSEEVKPHTESTNVPNQVKPPNTEEKPVTIPKATGDPLGWIKKTRAEEATLKGKLETPIASHATTSPLKNERVLRKDEVILRQETLIIGAIAATFLSIACFFIGHKVGYNKGVLNKAEKWIETIEPQPQQRETKKTTFGQSKPEEVYQKAISKAPQPKQEEVSQKAVSKVVPQKTEKQTEQTKPIIKDKWTLRVISYKNTKDNVEKAKELARALQNLVRYNAFVVNTGKELIVCVGEFEANDSPDLVNTQKTLAEFKYENKKQFDGCYPIRMK